MGLRLSAPDATSLLGLDWGTTNLRAFRLDSDGTILERREMRLGIREVPAGGFPDAFRAAVGEWLDAWPDAPVILSGMVTSRQGWVEVPYVACPAGPAEIAAGLLHGDADGRRVYFVPGLVYRPEGAPPDVLRGEEAQILGALEGPRDRGLFCLPGTHSKWVVVEDGLVQRFATHMTGEIYEVVRRHSILARSMAEDADFDDDAFDAGARRAQSPGGLLHHLFEVRTQALDGALPSAAAPSYLSGILIGHELRAALADDPPAGAVTLVGAGPLVRLYARTLAKLGVAAEVAGGEPAARGLAMLARALRETA